MPSHFFTADTHFGHARIIDYCKRPFTSAEEMEEEIIKRTNEVVRPGDILFHLGDVAWSSYDWNTYLERLNTKEVYLIWGNHDKHMRKRVDAGSFPRIRWARDIKTVQLPGGSATLCHYSMRSWPTRGRGGIHLYGHSHGKLEGVGRSMDVGVDTNEFRPWAWEDIKQRMEKIDYKVYE